MKIVSANIPESYIEAMAKLVGDGGLYPSRSELVRQAIRKFLIKEITLANEIKKELEEKESKPESDKDQNVVSVPVENSDNENPTREFKTYKIIRKLEF